MAANSENRAWAAGLFEGEGSLLLFTPKSRDGSTEYGYPRATVVSTDRDVIERFHEIVGVGYIYTAKRRRPDHHSHYKQQYIWRVTDREGFFQFADIVAPWLGERRRARLIEVMAGATSVQRHYVARRR